MLSQDLQKNMEQLQHERSERTRLLGESEVARKYFSNLVRESTDVKSRVDAVDLEGPAPGVLTAAAHL